MSVQTLVIAAVLVIAAACVLSTGLRLSSPATIRAILDAPAVNDGAAEHAERSATADLLAGRMAPAQYRHTVQLLAGTAERPPSVDGARRR